MKPHQTLRKKLFHIKSYNPWKSMHHFPLLEKNAALASCCLWTIVTFVIQFHRFSHGFPNVVCFWHPILLYQIFVVLTMSSGCWLSRLCDIYSFLLGSWCCDATCPLFGSWASLKCILIRNIKYKRMSKLCGKLTS